MYGKGKTKFQGTEIDWTCKGVINYRVESMFPGKFYYGREVSNQIIAAIESAGVTVKHYWAPVSFVEPGSPSGKYGFGHVDLLGP